jgi:hypothetical protein
MGGKQQLTWAQTRCAGPVEPGQPRPGLVGQAEPAWYRVANTPLVAAIAVGRRGSRQAIAIGGRGAVVAPRLAIDSDKGTRLLWTWTNRAFGPVIMGQHPTKWADK